MNENSVEDRYAREQKMGVKEAFNVLVSCYATISIGRLVTMQMQAYIHPLTQ